MILFLGLLKDTSKESALLLATSHFRDGASSDRLYRKSSDQLKKIPGAPFAYWVGQKIEKIFEGNKFEDLTAGRDALCGLSTLDNFRFLRLSWEVRHDRDNWATYYHGGIYSKFYDNFPLLIRWADDGAELKRFVEQRVGSASRKIQGEGRYFQEGFVFSRRTRAFAPKFMPRGGIFSTAGQAGFTQPNDLPASVALLPCSSGDIGMLLWLSSSDIWNASWSLTPSS